MSPSYVIRYLSTAEKDLIDIFKYIEKDNPAAAISQEELSAAYGTFIISFLTGKPRPCREYPKL